ncbi:DUF3046 domain-containing protein [Leucobacter triazinivorans]|uniref:DUF3046 domain-containing protein n=1 Tax=Leucobacter triazinivorans TaxID=1784719 RepID=A0A4P6KC30_9MICO|nr:DUF3046 domain-containing protein [Leucobacter triazinivorans]QBE47875.1 DUF3046 domain-containing protein [Leucobacter triazinivorans]
MRLSEFRRACVSEFGEDYSGVLLRDHWLAALGGTADEALDRGVPARTVWEALCADLGVPEHRRYGRGLRDPRE